MTQPIIVIGDKTSHGGTVVGAATTASTHGKQMARLGDKVTCPKCGDTTIAEGDNSMIVLGQPVARHGHKTACGATLIAGQSVTVVGGGGGGSSSAVSTVAKPAISRIAPTDAQLAQAVLAHPDQLVASTEPVAAPPMPDRHPLDAHADGNAAVIAYSDGSMETRRGGTLAWRNNNPGNIRAGSFANAHGALGSGPGGFAVFPDEATGYQAVIDNLNSSNYQSLTVGDAIARWAPASDNNNPVAYAQTVSDWTGVPASTPMNTLNQAQLGSVADAIQRFEGWQAGTVHTTPAPNH